MKSIADIESKVRIARESGTFVVLTVEEAEAVFAALRSAQQRARDAETSGRDAAAEERWKERQGDEYGSY